MSNYPVPYQNPWSYSGSYGQQYPSYMQNMQAQQAQPVSGNHGITWVDGEVGAKAYQMPAGWPANTPIALWDTNDTVIYLKSMNQMGMPNPLQKARYRLESYQQLGNVSEDRSPDMTEYVRKDDLDRVKQELMETISGLSISGSSKKQSAKEE